MSDTIRLGCCNSEVRTYMAREGGDKLVLLADHLATVATLEAEVTVR